MIKKIFAIFWTIMARHKLTVAAQLWFSRLFIFLNRSVFWFSFLGRLWFVKSPADKVDLNLSTRPVHLFVWCIRVDVIATVASSLMCLLYTYPKNKINTQVEKPRVWHIGCCISFVWGIFQAIAYWWTFLAINRHTASFTFWS